MAELRKARDPQDVKSLIDPIRTMLAADGRSADDVVEEIVLKMKLGTRTETQMILSENNADGLRWLSENITAINFGQHPRFSLPQRVTVFLPPGVVRKSPFDLSIIDTKGVHGTTERSDLQTLTSDPRSLCVLCSSFNDAPSAEPLKILKSLKDLGSDAVEKQRIVLLVLPRGDEAMKIIDDSGEPPDNLEEAFAIRSSQVLDTLKEAGLPAVPVLFFNALQQQSAGVWQQLCGQLETVRSRQLDRLNRFILLSEELVSNADAAKIQQARVTIAEEARAIAQAYADLPGVVRPAHQTLLSEIQSGHSSSIAAAVARRGGWHNFEVHHMVGSGVRADANLRTSALWTKMVGRIEALEDKFATLPEVHGLLQTLREDLADWRQEFLARAVSIGRNTFKPYMDGAEDFWSDLRGRYGDGPGYRNDIASMIRDWFEKTRTSRKRVARWTCGWLKHGANSCSTG